MRTLVFGPLGHQGGTQLRCRERALYLDLFGLGLCDCKRTPFPSSHSATVHLSQLTMVSFKIKEDNLSILEVSSDCVQVGKYDWCLVK